MINILFAGNEKVFDGVLTCILSILKRTETKEPFAVYLMTMDVSHIKDTYTPISDRQVDFLRGVIKKYNPENEVVKIDVTPLYDKEFANCPNEDAYCSPYTLIRLFADQVDSLPDKLLYLDVDIMFNRDVRLLYDTDVSGVEYAAARAICSIKETCRNHLIAYAAEESRISGKVIDMADYEKSLGGLK